LPADETLREALTFDDVLLVPRYSEVTPPEVTLNTQLTPGIALKIPILSAAMDKVTEHRTAITIARCRRLSSARIPSSSSDR